MGLPFDQVNSEGAAFVDVDDDGWIIYGYGRVIGKLTDTYC